MRHKKSYRKLGKTSSHRAAMFRNMTLSLLNHELIKTTLPKAKELRKFVEPLITLAKKDPSLSYRALFSYLQDRDAVFKISSLAKERFISRPGGYTRVLKCGFRAGDAAPMAVIALVE